MAPLRRLLILTHNYPPSFTPWCTIGAGRVPIRLRFCPISSFATQELQTILLLTTTQLFFLAMARVIMFSTQKKINKAKREDSVARTSSMRHFNTWGQGGLSWSLRKGSRRARRYDSHLKSQIEGVPCESYGLLWGSKIGPSGLKDKPHTLNQLQTLLNYVLADVSLYRITRNLLRWISSKAPGKAPWGPKGGMGIDEVGEVVIFA